MSQVIPGGRPRASSDGDILDDGINGKILDNLNGRYEEVSRGLRNPGKTVVNNNKGRNRKPAAESDRQDNTQYDDEDAFDSDGGISSQSQTSSNRSGNRRRRFSFKYVRKAVSRAFVAKDSKSESDKSKSTTDLSKIWTPDLRRIEDRHKGSSNGNDHSETSIMSSARPLITVSDPSIGMTVPKWKKTPGTVGIYNHGNSCYMNAVLQCMSNTDSFTEYFIKDFFKNDLKNSKNGKKGVFRSSHGEVTEQLGYMLKSLWSGKYTSEVSREFKAIVGKFNSQYKGDHQHDAQEFLLWLLDRVHEDVCTFPKKKNNKSQKASISRSDDELAQEASSVNGESFVLKLFQALHSSTLICPSCGERSSTFDPYLCVSLPLPQKCPRTVYVVVVFLDALRSHEVKMAVTMNQYESMRELRERISVDSEIPPKQLLLCQLKDDGFGCTYSDDQMLSDIPENEVVYAMEMYTNDGSEDESSQEYDSPQAQLLILHLETPGGSARNRRFCSPCVMSVRRDITWKALQKDILLHLDDAVCEDLLSQKLSNLFLLRVSDGSSRKDYLPSDIDMPLYTQAAERALNTLSEDFGPAHIKILVEWNPQTKKTVIVDDHEHVDTHQSVREAQSNVDQMKVSLEECFKLYTQEEKLIGDDAWLCPHCKQQQQGTIKMLGLWSLPDILVLHLKRFKQTGLRRSKLNTLVEFPVDSLDMSKHLTDRNGHNRSMKRDDYTYDLLGVSNHYGNMMGGHYTAFCRSPVDGEWREFNDTKVSILEGPVATKEAYILFYQRRSLSKDINQKLFMGDHWVFSLPLSTRIEEESPESTETSPRDDLLHRPRRSRSRSASPSAHRQGGVAGPRRSGIQPSTPQPTRRPMLSYYEDEEQDNRSRPLSPGLLSDSSPVRKSRPLFRQTSEPGSPSKRDKSAGTSGAAASRARDSSRTICNRRVDDDFVAPESKRASKYDIDVNANKSSSLPPGRGLNGRSRTPFAKQETSSVPSSKIDASSGSSGLKTAYRYNLALESDAKYPTTSHDISKHDSIRNGDLYETHVQRDYEPASALRVNLDEKHETSSSLDLKSHLQDTSLYSENARRKLAQLMKQNSNERPLTHKGSTVVDLPDEEESRRLVRMNSRKYKTQTSYDMAKRNPISLGYSFDSDSTNGLSPRLEGLSLETSDNLRGRDRPNFETGSEIQYRPEKYASYKRATSGYSRLDEDLSDEPISLPVTNNELLDSSLRPRTRFRDDTRFVRLADSYFGHDRIEEDRPVTPKYVTGFLEDSGPHSNDYVFHRLNGEPSTQYKFATIARSREMSPTRRLAREEALSLPRSNTDHLIQYNTLINMAPPPSPTPQHSLREERTFTHINSANSLPSTDLEDHPYRSSRLTDREIASIHSYEHAGRRSTGLESRTSSRGIPSYREHRYQPRPHRGIWGVKPKPPTRVGAVPTPCLRESSV